MRIRRTDPVPDYRKHRVESSRPYLVVLSPLTALLLLSLLGAFWRVIYLSWFIAAGWTVLLLTTSLLIVGGAALAGFVPRFPSPPERLQEFSLAGILTVPVAVLLLVGSCFVNVKTYGPICIDFEDIDGSDPACQEQYLDKRIRDGDFKSADLTVLPIAGRYRSLKVLDRYQEFAVVNGTRQDIGAIVTRDKETSVSALGSQWADATLFRLSVYGIETNDQTSYLLDSTPVNPKETFTVIAWKSRDSTVIYNTTFTGEELERLGWTVTFGPE